ncbi:MAG: methyltransferase domain-containing protein [Planctomycetes bacterium]|nr:methyltransferase domain-containing protein [Planctomycetota bacterium]
MPRNALRLAVFTRALLPVLATASLVACATAPTETPPATTTAVEQSVKPGINERYLAADLDPEDWVNRFEVESREIYTARHEIVAAAGLRPGMAVADVGAGTGLFVEPFAHAVGRGGRVFAVDIAPNFVAHIDERARAAGLTQVESRLCREDSVDLPRASIDAAFVCDTYHHFEYPQSSLRSIHEALRPGGHLVIIDFERIPGVSREWIFGHVRAGKDVFTAEIVASGFELVEEIDVDGLEENYCLRFRRR